MTQHTGPNSIAVKPSPAANIRRLAATGLDAADIRAVTGYSATIISAHLTSAGHAADEYDA